LRFKGLQEEAVSQLKQNRKALLEAASAQSPLHLARFGRSPQVALSQWPISTRLRAEDVAQ
jgi:hypothetical protein